MSFLRPDAKSCPGYYVPAQTNGPAPGIVVIQEWWGVNEQIKGVARRFAAAGYHTLVPDLYRGRATLEAGEAEHLMQGLDFMQATTQDLQGAVNHLKTVCPKVAVTGFCMGGALCLLAAAYVTGLSAAVCWYGVPPLEVLGAHRIPVPLLGHFAEQDSYFPPAQVEALEQALRKGGRSFRFYRYPAQHAFANESRPEVYDREASDRAWARTWPFLAQHMGAR